MKRFFAALFCLILLAAMAYYGYVYRGEFFGYIQTHDFIVNFDQSDEPTVNPLMGFAPRATKLSEAESCSLVYVDLTFRELSPAEGEYDFASFENEHNLIRWKKSGKHVVFRFICDKPGGEAHLDIPDWLYEKTGDGTHYDTDYGMGYSPDYSNETFIQYHADAIKALGERYGADTFFAYIELGSLGHWGEWHVKYADGVIRLPDAAVREKYVTPYIEAFPNSMLLMRRPFETAEKYGLGLYNDMAGDYASTQVWLSWINRGGDYSQTGEEAALVAMPEQWKSAPVGGELGSELDLETLLTADIEQTLSLLEQSHITFLGPRYAKVSSDSGQEYISGAQRVLDAIGYRIGVSEAVITEPDENGKLNVALTWTNTGAAPLYWDLPVYIFVLDGSDRELMRVPVYISLSKLLPGTELDSSSGITLPEPDGEYKLCVGVVDDMTGEAAVQLVSDGENIGRLLLLQHITGSASDSGE